MISLFLNRELRELRRARLAAHGVAMEVAWAEYERYKDEPMVITEGEGPGYSFISAAGPERLAWDAYFDSMRDQGFSAWDTQKRFEREFRPKQS